MEMIHTSTAPQEKTKLEITLESHSRLIKAREVSANTYLFKEENLKEPRHD
ncbi:hypothetical protein [Candidatus Williamhamiltonella defendens]|uniref:Uncharacterized protein n=1 Tax=Hamiltonella defensa subsp. Acyrthosiphon pisum (strain 5AT) TaxID=572265 RepID=C4K545_HAMD5|nr:hypothetical protein [Candidatus Hamiltonella defensa]ACQ67688.1 hypothetical protein HDEF_0986 [Candidatus Hamiltonella defensa 5AT (Acyrthosiphon pisum)]